MKRAFAYIRKSTDRKDMQKLSIETQTREILVAQKRASEHFGEEVEITEWFEEHISWGDSARPEFRRMCDAFANRKADVLLSWRLDRLSRNPIDSGEIMSAVQRGVIPCIQDSSRMYEKKDSGLIMAVIFGMGNQELMELTEKSRAGTLTLLEKWWAPCKVPFGYKNVKDAQEIGGKVVVDGNASAYVRKIFEMVAKWHSLKSVSRLLFESWFKTRNGSPFAVSTVEWWIKNPFYYGILNWWEHRTVHAYPKLIEKSLWDMANGAGRWSTPQVHVDNDTFPLRWIVKSSVSWRELTASLAKKTYHTYHTHARYRWSEDMVSISENAIHEQFWKDLWKYAMHHAVKPYVMRALRTFYSSQLERCETERKHVSSELSKTKNAISYLVDMRISGEISTEDFKRKQEELRDKEMLLSTTLQNVIAMDNAIMTDLTEAVELLTNLEQYWKTGDRERKNEIIKMIAVELVVTPSKTLYVKENPVFEWLSFLNVYGMEVPSGVEPDYKALQASA